MIAYDFTTELVGLGFGLMDGSDYVYYLGLGFGIIGSDYVYALSTDGFNIYAGGYISCSWDFALQCLCISKWNGLSWSAMEWLELVYNGMA